MLSCQIRDLLLSDAVAEEDEILDDGLPQGDLGSHMSWRDPDKGEPVKL